MQGAPCCIVINVRASISVPERRPVPRRAPPRNDKSLVLKSPAERLLSGPPRFDRYDLLQCDLVERFDSIDLLYRSGAHLVAQRLGARSDRLDSVTDAIDTAIYCSLWPPCYCSMYQLAFILNCSMYPRFTVWHFCAGVHNPNNWLLSSFPEYGAI
mgnify:CR=1 FL=1